MGCINSTPRNRGRFELPYDNNPPIGLVRLPTPRVNNAHTNDWHGVHSRRVRGLRATQTNRTTVRPDNIPGYVPRDLTTRTHYNATIRPSTRGSNAQSATPVTIVSSSTRCPSAASLRRPASPSFYLPRSNSVASARQSTIYGEFPEVLTSTELTRLYSTRLHRPTPVLSYTPVEPALAEEISRPSSTLSRTNSGRRGLPLVAGDVRPGATFSNTPESSPACEVPSRLQSPFSSPRRHGFRATSPRSPVNFQQPILEEDISFAGALNEQAPMSHRRTPSLQRREAPSTLILPSLPRTVVTGPSRSPAVSQHARLPVIAADTVDAGLASPLERNPRTPLVATPSSLMAQVQAVIYESPKFHPESLGWDLLTPALDSGFSGEVLALAAVVNGETTGAGRVKGAEYPDGTWI